MIFSTITLSLDVCTNRYRLTNDPACAHALSRGRSTSWFCSDAALRMADGGCIVSCDDVTCLKIFLFM